MGNRTSLLVGIPMLCSERRGQHAGAAITPDLPGKLPSSAGGFLPTPPHPVHHQGHQLAPTALSRARVGLGGREERGPRTPPPPPCSGLGPAPAQPLKPPVRAASGTGVVAVLRLEIGPAQLPEGEESTCVSGWTVFCGFLEP